MCLNLLLDKRSRVRKGEILHDFLFQWETTLEIYRVVLQTCRVKITMRHI